MTDDFKVIPKDEAEKIRNGAHHGNPPADWALKVEAGEMVFLARTGRVGTGKQSYLSQRGIKIRQVMGTRDGVSGFYVWAIKEEPDERGTAVVKNLRSAK